MVAVDTDGDEAIGLDVTVNEAGEAEMNAVEDSGVSDEAFIAVFEDFAERNNIHIAGGHEDVLFIPGDEKLIEKMKADCGDRFDYARVEKVDVEDFLLGVDQLEPEEDLSFEEDENEELEMYVVRHLDG